MQRFISQVASAATITLAGFALSATASAATATSAPTAATKHPQVLLRTSLGDIRLELYPRKAPVTVRNFLHYVKQGHYSGTIFHRVIKGFMIQGGGFTPDLVEKPTDAPIPLESQNGLKNLAGTIAMARTSDPNSATAQFFINTVNNPALDYPQPDGHGYAVFGKVTSGMHVVKKIEQVSTTTQNAMENVPTTPVVIQSAQCVANCQLTVTHR